MPDTSIKICDIVFDNPIIPASGTMGFGYRQAENFDLNQLPSLVLSGVTMKPERRDAASLYSRQTGGVLMPDYSPNPGVYRVQEEELPRLREVYKKRCIAAVRGNTVEEYVKVAEILDRNDNVNILELDLSCHNHGNSNIRFSHNATSLYKTVNEVKYRVRKPVFAKISPRVTHIRDMAKAAQDGGADGVVVSGTYYGRSIVLGGKNVEVSDRSRFSCAALKPMILDNVYEVFDAIGITIVSCGGVLTAKDALEMMCAGASLVQLDESAMVNPLVAVEIAKQLPALMRDLGIEKLSGIIGCAHR